MTARPARGTIRAHRGGEGCVNEKHLTFVVGPSVDVGRLIMTGAFDYDFGVSVVAKNDWPSVFGPNGMWLRKGEGDRVALSVSIRGPFQRHRFNLKFADPGRTEYVVRVSGQVAVAKLEVVSIIRETP